MIKFLYESFRTTPERLHEAMSDAIADKDETFFEHAFDLYEFEDIAYMALSARSMIDGYREGAAVVTTYPHIIKFLEVADRRYGDGWTFPNVIRKGKEEEIPVSDSAIQQLPYLALLDSWGMVIRSVNDQTQVMLLETEAREALV